jgi:peptidoglycan/xylan/chitin deacetylase (PgdA/CDA1 family)
VKEPLKRAISRSFGRLGAGDRGSRVVVLCYHSIHPTLPFASAAPELFDAHLEWLTGSCDVIPLRYVLAAATDRSRTRPAVAITFDDGYRDNHTHALPSLDRWGVPATFFVTVGLLERDPMVVERMAALRGTSTADVAGMSWGEVGELVASGHEVGSHTWSHPTLATLGSAEAHEELVRSKAVLEDRIGGLVNSLAYPFGKPGRHATGETERVARAAGYTTAAAVLFRRVLARDSPLMIPRFFPTQDDVEILAEKVDGRWDWLGHWQERAPEWLARRVSPADFRDLADDVR